MRLVRRRQLVRACVLVRPRRCACGPVRRRVRSLVRALQRGQQHLRRERQLLRRGQRRAHHLDERGGELFGRPLAEDEERQGEILLGRVADESVDVAHQAVPVAHPDDVGRGHRRPGRAHACLAQHQLRRAPRRRGHEEHRDALAPRPPSPAIAVLQHLGVLGQVRLHDQPDVGQVEPARGDVGGDQYPRPPVAQGLQGAVALRLRQLAGQRHGGKSALDQVRAQVIDRLARPTEHDGRRRIAEAQRVDDGVLALARRDDVRAHLDVLVRLRRRRGGEPQRILLVAPRELLDLLGNGRREHHRPALFRRAPEDALELVAKAHVQHLVGLVEDQRAQRRELQRLALDVIAEAPGRPHHDVGSLAQGAKLAAHVRAADAGGDAHAGLGEEPGQLGRDLVRELAGRRDDEGERAPGARRVREQLIGHREPERDRLARSRARADQEIAAARLALDHGSLHGRGRDVAARRERLEEGRGRCELGESVGHRPVVLHWRLRVKRMRALVPQRRLQPRRGAGPDKLPG